MNQKEFNKILQAYEAGQCSENECHTVELWYKNLQSEKEIANPLKSKSQMFTNISTDLEKKAKRPWPWMPTGLAAVLLVALSISTPPPPPPDFSRLTKGNNFTAQKPIVNKTSSPQLVTLLDGTNIILEPKSRLTVATFTETVRQVRLQGKAFFEVAHNERRPFYVYTENLVTQVLGTSFTINTVGVEGETVEVKTGRVAVFTKEQKSNSKTKYYVTITPNLQAEYNKKRKELIASVVRHPRIVSPVGLRGLASNSNEASSLVMQCEETPVSEILQSLEKAYGVKIIFNQNKLSSCLLTVNLKDEDLFTRLEAICHAIGGSYQVVGVMIVVSSKEC